MSQVITATFEDGVLKPSQPLNLPSHSQVRLTIEVLDNPAPSHSIFDLFGKAARLRTAEDIAAQVREEREAWGES